MLSDELAPGAVAATGCWRHLMAVEHSADGQVGAPVAELEELALDAAVAPPAVVGRQLAHSGSGRSFADVVQTSEDRPGDHLPGDRTTAGHRSLQTE